MNQIKRTGRVVVAIPARDEAEHIGACLKACALQEHAYFDDVVVFVNNSADATASIARSVRFHSSTCVHVVEQTLPAPKANAGFARRSAMRIAADLAGIDGVILTTDADGEVDADWLAANLADLENADAVAGWMELHPIDWSKIPRKLHEDDARECAYDRLCDRIHALLDPDPADPMPRHTQHSGASIAVKGAAFARCGGVPAVASGEDRALIAALRRVDARIRHSPEVHLTVSGRIDGRAEGGMADTIRRRLTRADAYLDDRLEPAAQCARRAVCRAMSRRVYEHPDAGKEPLARILCLPQTAVTALLHKPFFGMAWEDIESASPALCRQRVRVADLAKEMTAAQAILADLRPWPAAPASSSEGLSLSREAGEL